MKNYKDFNDGKPVPASEGGNGYDPVKWTIVDIKIEKASTIDHPLANALVAKEDKKNPAYLIVVDLETAKGEKTTEYQILRTNKSGAILWNLKRSEYNGKTYPATLLHDIWEAAKVEDPEQPHFTVKDFGKDRFVGLQFTIGTKFGTSKDGRDFVILETDYQKLKNEQYQAENQEAMAKFEDDDDKPTDKDLPF